jgi:hypothetical protein
MKEAWGHSLAKDNLGVENFATYSAKQMAWNRGSSSIKV